MSDFVAYLTYYIGWQEEANRIKAQQQAQQQAQSPVTETPQPEIPQEIQTPELELEPKISQPVMEQKPPETKPSSFLERCQQRWNNFRLTRLGVMEITSDDLRYPPFPFPKSQKPVGSTVPSLEEKIPKDIPGLVPSYRYNSLSYINGLPLNSYMGPCPDTPEEMPPLTYPAGYQSYFGRDDRLPIATHIWKRYQIWREEVSKNPGQYPKATWYDPERQAWLSAHVRPDGKIMNAASRSEVSCGPINYQASVVNGYLHGVTHDGVVYPTPGNASEATFDKV